MVVLCVEYIIFLLDYCLLDNDLGDKVYYNQISLIYGGI